MPTAKDSRQAAAANSETPGAKAARLIKERAMIEKACAEVRDGYFVLLEDLDEWMDQADATGNLSVPVHPLHPLKKN